MERVNDGLTAYKQMFPDARLNLFQMDLIESRATNPNVWRKVLEYWCGNGYRAESVFKMLEYYDELSSGRTRYGVPKGPDMHVGATRKHSEPRLVDENFCAFCHREGGLCHEHEREAAA